MCMCVCLSVYVEGASAFGESKHLLKEDTETGSQPTTVDGTDSEGAAQQPTVGFWRCGRSCSRRACAAAGAGRDTHTTDPTRTHP